MGRKRTLILIASLALGLSARAQYQFLKPELGVGVNQGVNLMPRVGFTPSVDQAFDARYHGGVTLRYAIQRHFGVQAEVNYSLLGWKETDDNGTYKRQLSYLEIPFLSHMSFGRRATRVIIHLGPEFRFLLHESASGRADGGEQRSMNIDNRFDFGLAGGLGLEFRTRNAGFFLLEARYNFGLSNLFDDAPGSQFSRSGNQAILVSFTYLYDVLKNK